MQDLGFIQLAVLIMVGLNLLMVVLTVGVKALRSLKERWAKAEAEKFEPALEEAVITGQVPPELRRLKSWKQDLLATLIIEYMALLRGAERDRLVQLAAEVGLLKRYFDRLGSRRRWQRARAAENLGYLGGPDAVGPLKKLLADPDETIRAVVARALARIGTPKAARALAELLDDPSGLTRLRVAENLARVGPLAVEPLVEILDHETDRAVAERKVFQGALLARLGTSEASQAMVEALDGLSGPTRLRVAKNLSRIGSPAVEPLVGLLTPRKRRAPALAAQILGNLRATEARPALRRAISYGENVDLKAQAALALGKIGNPEDVPTLLELCEDEEWPVRAQAANALGMIGETSTIPTLRRLATDQEWWVRLNATRVLANMGSSGERALVEILEDPDGFGRHRAAATLEAQGVTRRMVRELSAPDKKGERARRTIRAIIHAGATKHLRRLVQTMPDEENHRILQTMLAEANES
jgi:HEAT repeat protein